MAAPVRRKAYSFLFPFVRPTCVASHVVQNSGSIGFTALASGSQCYEANAATVLIKMACYLLGPLAKP